MTSTLKKISRRSITTLDSVINYDNDDEIDNELGWGDEIDYCAKLSGTLSFTESDNKMSEHYLVSSSSSSSVVSGNLGVACGGKLEPEKLVFEIVSVQIVKEGREKYVRYCVMVVKVPGLDTAKALVKRRYSDFYHLYISLQKKFSKLMKKVSFPKKTILGNFSDNTIAQRSRMFQQFLTYICSKDIIRVSKEIGEFFYDRELKIAYDFIRGNHYKDALPLLSNGLHLQEKLLGDAHFETISTRCGLIVCLNFHEEYNEAIEHAEIIIKHLEESENVELLYSILQLSIRLCWTIGRDKCILEKKFNAIRHLYNNVEWSNSLLEIALKRYT